MVFHKKSEMTSHEAIPGYMGSFIHGGELTIVHWDITKGHSVPEHSHHHEQFVNCLAGEFEMVVGDEKYVMGPGDTIVIPPNVKHSAYAITDAKCLDVFTPVRDDYKFD